MPEPNSEPGKVAIPDGIVPLFFSTSSQQLFECLVDINLTKENRHKLIPKAKILEDLKNRAAVSDFSPVKQKISDYPGEEVLLVYDYDFLYGENFYVCVTEESKALVLNPPVKAEEISQKTAEEENVLEQIPTTPLPKEWHSYGSEVEIEEGRVHKTRPLFNYVFSKKRRLFCMPCTLSDNNAADRPDSHVDILSHEDGAFSVKKLEMDIGVQTFTKTANVECQPDWMIRHNVAVQYASQGLSAEEVARLEEGDAMATFLKKVCPRVELCLQQNEIMNVFVDDYKSLPDTNWITGNKSDSTLNEYQSFTDWQFCEHKMVTYIEWHPTIKGIIAVSCGHKHSFDEGVELHAKTSVSMHLILLWSFTDPIHPQLFLEAPDDVLCFKFNPSNPNLIVAGCTNGQIVLWDITEYEENVQINKGQESVLERTASSHLAIFNMEPKPEHAPIVHHSALSSIEQGHKMAVCDLLWVPSHIELCIKSANVLENSKAQCTQLISGSIDGTIMFWDTRPSSLQRRPTVADKIATDKDKPYSYLDLQWKPFLKAQLPRPDNPGSFSVTRLSIKEKQQIRAKAQETTIPEASEGGKVIEGASTKYYIGTEDGEIVCGDWVPIKDSESGKLMPPRPEFYSRAHCGTVCCVERSPFFRDIILSVGGWNFAIWKEGVCSNALIRSHNFSTVLTAGTWSITRPGVFFIAKDNGTLDVWDLLDKSHEPFLTQSICSVSITSMVPYSLSSQQAMLALGDAGGTLHIFQLPWSLSNPSSKEVAHMEAFFEREVKKLEFVTERAEMRVKAKRDKDSTANQNVAKEESKDTPVSLDAKAKKMYEDYLTMERTLLIQLGVIEGPKD